MPDIIIIGGGPAGLSAAITARQRGKTASIVSTSRNESGLFKAREVNNYPAFPGISGSELLCKMTAHAAGVGAELLRGSVSVISPLGSSFSVGYGTEIISGTSVIIATGIVQTSSIPGETELLGRGVSYCATCDGMLFRGKRVCVLCLAPDADHEADFLESIGCTVIRLETEKVTINGTDRVTSVTHDGDDIPCAAVFILRRAVAPHLLLPQLALSDGHIAADKTGATNIPGIFAAGDCTGTPYQIAKATGEGLCAALSAVDYIESLKK